MAESLGVNRRSRNEPISVCAALGPSALRLSMNTSSKAIPTVSQNQLRVLDRILSSFDRAWKKGVKPQLEHYLRESPTEMQAELFEALLKIELESRSKCGEAPQLPQYLARFPDKTGIVTTVFSQVISQSTFREAEEQWFYLR